jgi:DNA replication licensing factor MCM4
VESRYNPRLSVVENVQLPPTLLSRFDLIFLILDRADKRADRRLGQHLVALYYDEAERESMAPAFSTAQLTEYISFARAHINPHITDSAKEAVVAGYLDMRAVGREGGQKIISATPRQIESVIRLAEAHARMRLSATVDVGDVHEAIRLIKEGTLQAAVDPKTGQVDMQNLGTGRAAGAGDLVSLVKEAVHDLLAEQYARTLTLGELHKKLAATATVEVAEGDLRLALRQLEEEGALSMDPRTRVITIQLEHGTRGRGGRGDGEAE